MEESKGYRKHDRQFKEEAVKLVTEGNRPVAEVARGLGIHENLLRTWKKKYKEDPSGSFPGKGHLKPQEEEFKRLQPEVGALGQRERQPPNSRGLRPRRIGRY